MATEPQVIIGRAKELADLGEFLGGVEAGGPTALVLDGEMGIGKTALWKGGAGGGRRSLICA
ncbi:MAG: ATP-binding protein [Gaiella sp.]|nr:ATP-binding protein [Gaiella sp.]